MPTCPYGHRSDDGDRCEVCGHRTVEGPVAPPPFPPMPREAPQVPAQVPFPAPAQVPAQGPTPPPFPAPAQEPAAHPAPVPAQPPAPTPGPAVNGFTGGFARLAVPPAAPPEYAPPAPPPFPAPGPIPAPGPVPGPGPLPPEAPGAAEDDDGPETYGEGGWSRAADRVGEDDGPAGRDGHETRNDPGDRDGDEDDGDFLLSPPAGGRAPSGSGWETGWTAVVAADRGYFEAMLARSGPDARGLRFPSHAPERHVPLAGGEVTVGRRRNTTGEVPGIDLSGAFEDPGVSHRHAVLVRQSDGTWSLVDRQSTNGTTVNGSERSVEPFVPVPLREGDRVHVGAWTTITLRRS
ncbi:FHA domain-containing protein [Streptomyces sp. NPDC059637]|uniref:FHA domain-containing protein n=1 Tax=Streptomyces sp. NPDC059637 TaxID=3347752 RepID=UPI00368E0AEA